MDAPALTLYATLTLPGLKNWPFALVAIAGSILLTLSAHSIAHSMFSRYH